MLVFGPPFVKHCPLLSHRCPVCLSVMLVYCSQTVRWIKMKLGLLVCLGPGHIVLDGDPAPLPQKGGRAAQFLAHVSPNGWMDQDGTWRGGRPRSRPHCARWRSSSSSPAPCPPKRGQSPHFWSISIVAKWLDASRCHLVRR